MKKDIGFLVHGRHLQAREWERLVWGESPDRLGVLPRFVLEVIRRGPERVGCVVFGTGASERDGKKEAEYTVSYLLERFSELTDFTALAEADDQLATVKDIVAAAVTDTETQNTREEVVNASRIFTEHGCTEIYQVTGSSHLPRAALEMLQVRHAGIIPHDQYWYPVGDDMAYSGTEISDVAVIEPPHRGDDGMIDAPIQMHQVVPKLYKLPPEKRIATLQVLNSRINEQLET